VIVRRLLPAATALLLLAGGCGSGPSLTEYADELEAIVTTMNARIDAIDAILDADEPTVADVHAYARDRVEARTTFLAALETIHPPGEAADLHDAALEVIRNLVAAEQALAEQALASDSLRDLDGLWDSPTGQAARAADEQAVAICQAAEAAINSTEDRQALVGMPWVPTELQEVVNVAFGCTAADR